MDSLIAVEKPTLSKVEWDLRISPLPLLLFVLSLSFCSFVVILFFRRHSERSEEPLYFVRGATTTPTPKMLSLRITRFPFGYQFPKTGQPEK